MAARERIADILNSDIDKYRISSFETFGMNIYIHPTKGAKEVQDTDGNFIGFSSYDFESWSNEAKSLRVRYHRRQVQVRYLGRWRKVEEYLKQLQPQSDPWDSSGLPTTERQHYWYDQQSRWWRANGKKFQFLKLPAEIREIVYKYAIGPFVEPYPTHSARRLGQHTGHVLSRMPNLSLLKTCRMAYHEAGKILFCDTPFFMGHYAMTAKLVKNIPQRTLVRHLTLALSHDDFFKLFGGTPCEGGRKSPSQVAYALRYMKLDALLIEIAAPSNATATTWLDGACQRTVVHWMFVAAYPFIRGHLVKFSGYLKDGQRYAFEATCAEWRQHFKLWQKEVLIHDGSDVSLHEFDGWIEDEDGGVRLNKGSRAAFVPEELFEPEEARFSATTPQCECEPACTVETWSAED